MRADAAENGAVQEGRIAVTLTCARGLPEQPEASDTSRERPLFPLVACGPNAGDPRRSAAAPACSVFPPSQSTRSSTDYAW